MKKLSDYYGKPMNSDTAKEILARYETGKRMPQAEIDAVLDATGLDLSSKYESDALSTYKVWLQSRIIKVNKTLFKSIARDLYGISLSEDVLNSDSPLKEFRKYLESDINVVEDALKSAVGRTLSMDVQSQFLSAATDNAKELILARVKSNSLTNPIISAMMLLGYDINVIIDFLYDPTIEKIVLEFSKRKNELQNVSITSKGVADLAVGGSKTGPAKKSLISILEVAEAINKFRAVRSLNENTKIRQNQLDRIIYDVDHKKLYSALRNREVGDLVETGKLSALDSNKKKDQKDFTNPAKDIFDVDKMILLNTITSKIYRHIYEVENDIIPAISHNSTTVREIADRTNGAGEKEYKNIDSFLSDKVTAAFYASPIGTKRIKDEQGRMQTVPAYRTGAVYKDGKVVYVELNDQANKAEFIDNFEAYFNHMLELKDLNGNKLGDNAALQSMIYSKTFKATNPILGMPKLRHAQPDNIDVSNILQGLKELKTDLDDSLTGDKLELYNNLANYAMIVSSGEVKKGTMIDVFLEINDDLASFITTLTAADYKKFIPRTDLAITLVKGNIPTIEKLIRVAGTNRRFNEDSEVTSASLASEEQDAAAIAAQDIAIATSLADNVDQDYIGDMEYTAEEKKVFTYDALSKEAASPVFVNSTTAGEIFRIIDKDISDAIFYGQNPDEIAYRIFPAGSKESNPIATLPTSKYLSTVSTKLMQDLADIGMQIGYSATYNGKPIQIIGFKGTEVINGSYYDIYNIWYNGKPGTAKGIHLMQDNDGLDLRKNIIRPLRSGDVDKYNNYRDIMDKLPPVDREIGLIDPGTKNAPQMNAAFKDHQEVLLQHPVAQKEARQIAPVITLDNLSTVPENVVHNIYHSSSDLSKANEYARIALVPSLFKRKLGENSYIREDAEINQLKKKVIDIINNIGVDSSITLYGIQSQLSNEFDGGMDIVDFLLSDLWDNAEYNTFFNGHFTVTDSTNHVTGVVSRTITRTAAKGNPLIQMVGGKIIPIFTKDKKVGDEVIGQVPHSKKYITRQASLAISTEMYINAVLAGVLEGKIDIPYKTSSTKYGPTQMARTEYITLPPKKGKSTVYIKKPGTINEFVEVRSLSNDFSKNHHTIVSKGYYAVSPELFAEMSDMNPESKIGETTIIKKGC